MPRKTLLFAVSLRACSFLASMRPRPDAAENAIRERKNFASESASMRPRPDAAENRDAGEYLMGVEIVLQ